MRDLAPSAVTGRRSVGPACSRWPSRAGRPRRTRERAPGPTHTTVRGVDVDAPRSRSSSS